MLTDPYVDSQETSHLLQQRSAQRGTILNEKLQAALDSRVLIEQAKGKLAERQDVDTEQACTALRGYARSHKRRLSDVARAFIDGSAPPPAAHTPGFMVRMAAAALRRRPYVARGWGPLHRVLARCPPRRRDWWNTPSGNAGRTEAGAAHCGDAAPAGPGFRLGGWEPGWEDLLVPDTAAVPSSRREA
jgi:hypothetical protein